MHFELENAYLQAGNRSLFRELQGIDPIKPGMNSESSSNLLEISHLIQSTDINRFRMLVTRDPKPT